MDERLAYYLLYNDQRNVCRSVLNQELITFESLGWIKREKDRINILRPEKLKEIL